jgi:hypothetical protein
MEFSASHSCLSNYMPEIFYGSEGAGAPYLSNGQESNAACTQDIPGSLAMVASTGQRHEAAAGVIGQILCQALFAMGQARLLQQLASPRVMIGFRKKASDMAMRQSGDGFGNCALIDGFGYPFPNLIVEVACSEHRDLRCKLPSA